MPSKQRTTNVTDVVALAIPGWISGFRADYPSRDKLALDLETGLRDDLVGTLHREFAERTDRLLASADYTAEGRVKRERDLKTNALQVLTRLKAKYPDAYDERGRYHTNLVATATRIVPPSDAEERREWLAYARDIRTEWQAHDPVVRSMLFRDVTDKRIIYALENAPDVIERGPAGSVALTSLIPREVVAECRMSRLAADAPDRVEEIAALHAAAEIWTMAINAAKAAIVQFGSRKTIRDADDLDRQVAELDRTRPPTRRD